MEQYILAVIFQHRLNEDRKMIKHYSQKKRIDELASFLHAALKDQGASPALKAYAQELLSRKPLDRPTVIRLNG
jgi:hypothetical protein